ncbi:hypothetical protein DOM21_02105 [Bacteriovorax stolpii]|uniref:Uncharacterized protein n=1 Tax=Bacteriovorax stolpii TaxID=960 RepID=A0A2K9NW54_BACTC|nr:hypothetical protein [Bacteriovorax stolpii]AUN99736.1 hypothetical protein C0V70_16805 [Bacteriovorax stolpii]QDK40267.1 hypothetical protein DOM21_02105 [Bacteriovorax stolpii]TDP51369.1 hypothetical protein C8D79_3544 [Bacteriovorax stolpii]BDT29925.1 hypothetical protein BHI3_33910 [Bacteriovorax sp. HI3]
MDIRLITVKEDFEKAFRILDQREYPLSFYEYTLKHDSFRNPQRLKLIGAFQDDECVGTISYKITPCPHLGRILEIQEMHQKNIKGYKVMMDFLDEIARDEECLSIKICKNKAERLDFSFLDRFETFLKKLIA